MEEMKKYKVTGVHVMETRFEIEVEAESEEEAKELAKDYDENHITGSDGIEFKDFEVEEIDTEDRDEHSYDLFDDEDNEECY